MKTVGIILFTCVCACWPKLVNKKPYYDLKHAEYYFNDFIVKYYRHYADSDERALRRHIFVENLKKINEWNSNPKNKDVYDINAFADWTDEEISATRDGSQLKPVPKMFLVM